MKNGFALSLGCLALVAGMQQAQAQDLDVSTIYGDDNRKDLYDVTDSAALALADSTVALFSNGDIRYDSQTGKANLSTEPFGDSMNMCDSERFVEQPTGAFCSGSLVAPDIMMTAGHCITSESECANTSFVFGFGMKENTRAPTSVNSTEVYRCKNIIAREQVSRGADYALVRLEREVVGHQPLALNSGGDVSRGAKLVVIGHPAGLPTKVADGASVRDPSPSGFFTANLDTFGGNSGSAVFNQETGRVEGILVRGERDYVYNSAKGCYLSNVCADDGCRGEDVTKISSVIRHLPGGR